MIPLLRHFVGWLIGAFRSRQDLMLENLALRQQLLALHAKRPRRRLGSVDKCSGSLSASGGLGGRNRSCSSLQFERDLIRERTSAGREAAKQRGVHFGRPRKLNTDQTKVATQLLSEGKAVRDIARTFDVHEATIYRLAAAL